MPWLGCRKVELVTDMARSTSSCKPELFRDLTEDEFEALLGTATRVTARKGRILYMPEETGEALFFVQEGAVQIYRISPEGKKFVINNLHSGAIFGEMALIGQRMHNSFAQALEDSILCVVRRDELERLLVRKPRVALRILDILGRRLAETENRLEDMAFRSVPARLASLLLRLSEGNDGLVDGLSHQDLAEMIGTYRETVTQALNQFKASRVVEVQRKRIHILKPDQLRQIARDGA